MDVVRGSDATTGHDLGPTVDLAGADIGAITPEPDFAMLRAPTPLLKALFLVFGLITADGVVAASNRAGSDASKRPNNSFNLYVVPPPGASNVQLPMQGAGIASNRAVILDPYKVPLIQDAASLTPGR